METTYIVLIALTVIYIPLFLYVRFRKKPEKSVLEPYGPCIMIRTKVGIKLIDRLGRYKRFWHVCGYASRIITVLLMAYIVGLPYSSRHSLVSVAGASTFLDVSSVLDASSFF